MTTLQWTIIKPSDKNQDIWRYLTFDKFYDLINTSELYLRRQDKLIDEFEGKLDKHTERKIPYVFSEYNNSSEMQMELYIILNNIRKICFINCWHLNKGETKDMWKTYCGSNEGVAVKSTIDNLTNSIKDHDFGPMHFRQVEYGERDKTENDLRFPLELINFKAKKYSFENEFRVGLIYTKAEKPIEKYKEFEEIILTTPESGIKLKIDLNCLIEEIIISPFADQNYREKIIDLCLKKLKLKPINSILTNNI